MSHYDDVTLALLALGETGVTPDSEAHLATCSHCRSEVTSLASVAAVARTVEPADRPVAPPSHVWDRIVTELEEPAPGDAPLPAAAPLPAVASVPVDEVAARRASRGWRRALPLAAAAMVGVIVGGGGMYAATQGGAQPEPAPVAVASLKPYDDPSARGEAVIRQASTSQRTLTVRVTGLPAQPAGAFYEVWLMDPSNAHLVALGVLDAQGQGTFAVPAGLDLNAYSAVDVSLQPMNGSPLHSGDSPVRGEIST